MSYFLRIAFAALVVAAGAAPSWSQDCTLKSINDRLIKVMGLPADTAPKVFSAKQKQCLCNASTDGEFATCFGGGNGQSGEKIAGEGEGKNGKNRGGR